MELKGAAGLAGATPWRGTRGFGRTSRIRTAKVLALAQPNGGS